MATDLNPIWIETKTEETRRVLEKIILSKAEHRIRRNGDSDPSELLIYQMGEDVESDLKKVQSVLDSHMVKEVFLVSSNPDPEILVKALRAGVREFLKEPIQEAELLQAFDRLNRRKSKAASPTKNGKIIDVVGAKGGVGNTTLAVNLAANLALQSPNQLVALMDMNLLFGEVPTFLDFKPSFDWGELARNISRLDATFLMSVTHRHASGVHVVPSPHHLNGNFEATPDVIKKLLQVMKNVFDYVVIDSGHLADELSLRILEISDEALLTAILSLPCLTNVKRLLRYLSDLGIASQESIKIVINRYLSGSDISLKDAEKVVERQIFWTVPNDFKVTVAAINQGKTLFEIAPRSPVSRSVKDLAGKFVTNTGESSTSRSFFARWFSRN
ncbi:AAA family ATPase [Desulforhabdus sp. TSK]|uniref:AAA family ATPase n=1 Tax=Desulforhabdus sp. TSK TaxID=2925014 RepID=UPI001FC7E732|nr:AAA family ATPase [Desulforhabdus sp. TSK]GKT09329.1 transcriptional regulator [Desulforhabdus sp. TSK]